MVCFYRNVISYVFGFFLGSEYELKILLIFVAIIVFEFIILWLLCFLLIKFEKSKYIINTELIQLLKNSKEIFRIEIENIIKIHYVKFIWMLLLQMGSGYLHVEYTSGTEDKKFSTIFPTGKKIHSISMSLKQAKTVSKMLKKELEIK